MVSGFASVTKNIDVNGRVPGGGASPSSVRRRSRSACHSIRVPIASNTSAPTTRNSDRCDASVLASIAPIVNATTA